MFEKIEERICESVARYISASHHQVAYAGNADPRNLLEVGGEYKIKRAKVRGHSTTVELEAFPGKHFNSVYFWFKHKDSEEFVESIREI